MAEITTINKFGGNIFGIEMTGMHVIPSTDKSDTDKFTSKILYRQMDFTHNLHELSEKFAIELRYLFDPATPYKICVYFLVRFLSCSGEFTGDGIDRFSKCLLNLLAVNFPMHEFSMISEKDQLYYLTLPFEFNHIAEVVRREDVIPLDSVRKTTAKSIGFASAEHTSNSYKRKDMQIYHVFPFLLPLDNFERLCNVMLLQQAPCLLSICMCPYQLTETDEHEMEARISLCEKFSQIRLNGSTAGDVDKLSPFLNKQASCLYENCAEMLTNLQDAAFLKKIQLASSAALSTELLNTCGTSFTEHTGHPNLSFKKGTTDKFSGGYDWNISQTAKQHKTAKTNLESMAFNAWIPSQAPLHLHHWRYLFDISQSSAAFRLPFPKSSEFPGINTYQYNMKNAPSDLPAAGLHIGDHVQMNQKRPIFFKTRDRRRHTYVIGQTGTGKSTLFYHMIMQDITAGRGVGVIDPHENLIDDILESIPEDRLKDVVLFDPIDRDFPVGLNPLSVESDFEKDFAVNYLIEIFDTLYNLSETGGPMFEMYMRNALLLLIEQPKDFLPSVIDVPKLFQNERFRENLIEKCQNPYVTSFWAEEAEKVEGDAQLKNIAPYITSKLSRFIYNDLIRGIFGQRRTTLNFKNVMDEGKIFLVNLSKGSLGKTNSHFLGMILVGKLFTAALTRKTFDGNALKDFFLYVDEFQNLATPTFAAILSESRKYRLSLTLTNQYISQLSQDIINGILGNIGTLVSFRLGFSDAEIISKELSKLVSTNDLMGLSNYEIYLRLLVNGTVSAPFNATTVLPEYIPVDRNKSHIQRQSREQYGRPRDMVEREIQESWQI